MTTQNSTIDTKNRKKCKACGLYLNQLPVLDKRKESSIFWVGLSSVLITDEDEKIPLSPSTRSGALISKIEKPFQENISFYKTNVVKCLPLSNNKIRYPLKHEMEKCFPNLIDEIESLKPKIIFLLGKQVAKFVLEQNSIYNFSLDEQFDYNSFVVNDIKFVPIHHPSFILVYRRKLIDNYIKGIASHISKTTAAKPLHSFDTYGYHPYALRHIAKTHITNHTTIFCQRAFKPVPLQYSDYKSV